MRNVTACPVAGISPTEAFDVTPYAAQLSRYFLRHELTQALPRKFKIAFDGCATEGACIGAAFHDIAAVAALREGARGFRLYVGGGLGNTPKPARLLEEFTPASQLVRTAHAIVDIFNAKGNRQNRNRARLKFLIATLGWDEFRRQVFEKRATIPDGPPPDFTVEEGPPAIAPRPFVEPPDPTYAAWKRDNVVKQRQPGFNAVTVLLPLGDITSAQLRALAENVQSHADGRARLTIGQNMLLRWVPDDRLPTLWKRLRAVELAEPGAGTILDVTACPGADTCNLGITSSRGLARALRQTFREDAAVRELTIKISGCPNSCGQHHVADIGLHGASRKVGDVEIPSYNLLLGGSPTPVAGDAEFGVLTTRVAARLAPAAVQALAAFYVRERAPGERFRDVVLRARDRVDALLAPFADDPRPDQVDSLRVDWGQERQFVAIRGVKGECAV